MAGKDYYQILGVTKEAGDSEIKQAYRKLALRYHPDRNPGDRHAESRFKEISEAYGVLMDKGKRKQYDFGQSPFQKGYGYRQEDIFRDMFTNPDINVLFRDLGMEFQRYGVRFDQDFLNRVFFGGKGIFFGGIFFGGPFFGAQSFRRGSSRTRSFADEIRQATTFQMEERSTAGESPLHYLKRKIGTLLLGSARRSGKGGNSLDIDYHLTLSPKEAASGSKIRVAYQRGDGPEKLDVTVPPGTRSGSRLRLKGKGMPNSAGGEPGDLYLHIRVVD
jgi:DnaJ-class molecular chaperone